MKICYPVRPPKSEAQLMAYAHQIAGKTFADLAMVAEIAVPKDLLHAKGWIGQLLEWFLGATAASRSAPDFEYLQIELKTLPVNCLGQPKESTYVCVAPLLPPRLLVWQDSIVYRKLRRVLWVPVEANADIPIPKRRIGVPALWSPTLKQERILQQDWEEHMENIATGQVEKITAHQGVYLQIRPKAANAKALTTAIGPAGNIIQTLPRGFYLRTQFTKIILKNLYISNFYTHRTL